MFDNFFSHRKNYGAKPVEKFVRQQHELLSETPEKQRSCQKQQDEEKGTGNRGGQEEAKARNDLRKTSKANKSHDICPRLKIR